MKETLGKEFYESADKAITIKRQQTAVDFLHSEYKRIFADVIVTPEQVLKMADALAQAKETEKEHIMDAYDAGLFDGSMFDIKDRIYKQYYNETFNK